MICELLGQWLLLKSLTFCFLRFGTDFEGFWGIDAACYLERSQKYNRIILKRI